MEQRIEGWSLLLVLVPASSVALVLRAPMRFAVAAVLEFWAMALELRALLLRVVPLKLQVPLFRVMALELSVLLLCAAAVARTAALLQRLLLFVCHNLLQYYESIAIIGLLQRQKSLPDCQATSMSMEAKEICFLRLVSLYPVRDGLLP
uniref:DUF3778 domain-containing protein n=1 Tax=Oryza nivara TaxID=4536 RepID=A0A0E0FNK1_ORYNI